MTTTTAGMLLGGRVHYAQPAQGYRTGLEPVLLAACVPARAGERALEVGTGAGAGLLCLATRVPGIAGLGLEQDPLLAALAADNFAANGFGGLAAVAADVARWQSEALFDHAFANPPWHAATGTESPVAGRRAAKQVTGDRMLATWVAAMARALRPRGTISLILPAALLTEAAQALAASQCGEMSLLPLWPRVGAPAKLIVVRAVRVGRGQDRVLPGLVLHDAQAFTPQAEAILRGGAVLMA